MAVTTSRPLAFSRPAAASTAGTTWMPGWPRQNWLPSSSSSIVPAVPLRKAARLKSARRPAPITAAPPASSAGAIRPASAMVSGSCAPAAMAAIQSPITCSVRATTGSGNCS